MNTFRRALLAAGALGLAAGVQAQTFPTKPLRIVVPQTPGGASDTLAEDFDLSIRAQLAGWGIRYLDGVEAPAELPAANASPGIHQTSPANTKTTRAAAV